MKLVDELVSLYLNYEPELDSEYIHKQETVDELYELVANECRQDAKYGCGYSVFGWSFVQSDNETEWEEQHKICLEVVQKLKEEGLTAYCDDVFSFSDGYHYINIRWVNRE